MPDKILEGLEPDELPQPSRQMAETGVVITDLGQVMPRLRGAYDAAATYVYLDIVSYNGACYICRKDSLTGVAPVDGEDWMLLVDTNTAVIVAQKTADEANAAAAAAQQTADTATSRTWELSVPVAEWSGDSLTGYTQTVSALGMDPSVWLAGYLVPVLNGGETLDEKKAIQNAVSYISEVESQEGNVLLTCYAVKPEQDFTVRVTEVR